MPNPGEPQTRLSVDVTAGNSTAPVNQSLLSIADDGQDVSLHPGHIQPTRIAGSLWADVISNSDWQIADGTTHEGLSILVELLKDVEQAKNECISKRWRYKRKSGEIIIFRDIFDKIAKWIDLFKQVGDIAVQYDPIHAGLPWAGVRFLLQIAITDLSSFAFIVEDAEMIAELITRFTILEQVYLERPSPTIVSLQLELRRLYKAIAAYLSDAKRYFQQNSFKERTLKSATIGIDNLSTTSRMIKEQVSKIRWYTSISDAEISTMRHSELNGLLVRLDEPMRRIDKTVENMKDKLERSERMSIQNWISSQPYKLYHSQSRKGILSGSGAWLLQDEVFRKWRNDSVSSILWLHGIPGSGKSKLVSIVVDEMLKDCALDYIPSPAYFYCSQNPAEPGRSEPDDIMASIVRQLSNPIPNVTVFPPVLDLYRGREEEGFASGPISLEESVTVILQLSRYYPQMTVIIDAIDECHFGKRAVLLDALEEVLHKSVSMVKIFVSSRDDHDIVCHLRNYPDLRISSSKNMRDIEAFIKAEAESLVEKGKLLRYCGLKEELKVEIIRTLCAGAAGMFRWASLQLEYLCTLTTAEAIRERLGRPPPKLTDLYEDLYSRIERFQESDLRVASSAFKWLLCAKRQLKTREFLAAIGANLSGRFIEITKESILSLCSNFILLDTEQDVFRFAHFSVREYLEMKPEYSKELSNSLAVESCLCRLILAAGCGGPYTPTSLGYKLDKWTQIDNGSFIPPKQDFTYYAMLFWAKHVEEAGEHRFSEPFRGLLSSFILGNPDGSAPPPFVLWMRLIKRVPPPSLSHKLLASCCSEDSPLFVCCAYGLAEFVGPIFQRFSRSPERLVNNSGRSALEVAIHYRNLLVFKELMSAGTIVTEAAVEAAAGSSNIAFMSLLLELPNKPHHLHLPVEAIEISVGNTWIGEALTPLLLSVVGHVDITIRMLWGASENAASGKENMALLLKQSGVKSVPDDVIIAAASNRSSGLQMMHILLSCPEKVHITREVLMAAARNPQSGPDVIALLISRLGKGILPSNVSSTNLDLSSGVAIAMFLLEGERSGGVQSALQQPVSSRTPDIASEFAKAWEIKLSSDFEATRAKVKSTANLESPSDSSPSLGEQTPMYDGGVLPYNRASRSWTFHPAVKRLFTKYPSSVVASTRASMLKYDKTSPKHDIQGIDWDLLGTTKSDARDSRKVTYYSYRNIAFSEYSTMGTINSTNLSKGYNYLPNSDSFFEFNSTFMNNSLDRPHFQLSNLLACATNDDVYYVANSSTHDSEIPIFSGSVSGIYRLDGIPNRDTMGVKGAISEDVFPGRISALAADSNVIAAGGLEGKFAVISRSVIDPQLISQGSLTSSSNPLTNYVMMPDARHASFASNDGFVRDVEYETGKTVVQGSYDFAVNCHDRSPDGRLQVVVGDDPQVLVSEVQTGKVLFRLDGHRDYGFACAWSDNGWHVATGNQDCTIKIWDARMWTSMTNASGTANPLETIDSEMGCVRKLIFSPAEGGKRVLLAAESADNVSVIDADTFQSRQVIDFFGNIGGASFTPDGQNLYIAISDEVYGGVLKYSRRSLE